MNTECLKKEGLLLVTVLVSIMVIMISGCSSSGSGSSGSSDQQYQQKVYIIGEIKDPENNFTDEITAIKGPADSTKRVFVNRVPYDGVSSDAPIFMAADQVLSLSDTVKQGLLATYRNSKPIILIRGGETEINALMEILERVPNYKLPQNYPYAEMYAVSTEMVGNFSLSIYPPGSSDPSSTPGAYNGDDTNGLLARADALRNWVTKSGTRTMSQALADSQASAKQALAASSNDISKSDLTELIKAEVDEKHFTSAAKYGANTYSVVYTMYPFHQFNASDGKEYDWLYVQQEGVLSAEPRYTKFGGVLAIQWGNYCVDPWWYGVDECKSGNVGYSALTVNDIVRSIGKYRISNKITDTTVSYGLQGGSSPSTTNEKTTTTSGIKFDMGGDFGFKGTGKIAKESEIGAEVSTSIKGAVSISNEKTFDTYDCTVQNVSSDIAPTWSYEFSAVEQYGWNFVATKLKEPVKLSRSTFQPIHKWIWRFSPNVREKVQNFETTLEVGNLTSMSSHGAVFWVPVEAVKTHTDTEPFTGKPALPFPPVIVAPSKNLNLDKKAQFKTLEVSVGRDWNATCDQDWCQAAPTTGKGDNPQFSVTVSENTTGKERKATITFKTSDYKGSTADNKYKLDKMYVTQAPL